MGIYQAKNGDVMGHQIVKFGRKEKRDFAIKKQAEEERETFSDYYKVKRLASKMEEKRKEMRKVCGLE